MLRGRLAHIKRVTAKGHRYEYFDTGVLNERGRPVLKRLPARTDPTFGSVYASMLAGRTRRANVVAVVTLPDMIARYESSPEFRKLKPSTQKTYGTYLRLLEDQLAPAPARGVERSDILMLRDAMADRTGAANGMVRTTRALYAWGRKREIVDHDPCRGIELFDSEDYEPWPPDLLAAALASDDPEVSRPTALLYFSAQRIGDACALRWTDVRDGFIHLTQEKTGKYLEVRVHRDLQAVLSGMKPRGMTILADEAGHMAKDDTVRDRLQAFASERGHKIVPHGLRKNAVIAMLEAGCSIAETAAVTGQSLKLVEHYAKRRSGRRLSDAAILKMEGAKA